MRQLTRLLSAVCAFAAIGVNAVVAQDGVEELRQALSVRKEDQTKASEFVVKHREGVLQKRIDALRDIGELRRALTLREWKGNTALDVRLLEQNLAFRAQVGRLLEARLKAVADKAGPQNATSRLAVAVLIAELGPEVPDTTGKETGGFARSLTPIVAKLAQDPDVGVKEQALRALGTINAAPAEATGVFRKTLSNPGETLGPRRLAADGLGQLMRVLVTLEKRTGNVDPITPEQKRETIREVAGASAAALTDGDPQVRALGLAALQLAAQALSEMVDVRQRMQPQGILPVDRPMTPDEIKAVESLQLEVLKDIKELEKELTVMNDQGPHVLRVLRETEPRVQLAALQALESIGYVRLRIRHLAGRATVGTSDSMRKVLAAADPLGKFLAGNGLGQVSQVLSTYVSQGDPIAPNENAIRIRRTAMDFLATLEDDATPALADVIRALGDSDRFVRWSAITVLENVPADKRVAAVPGLAKLLVDYDLNVRLEATKVIASMGSRSTAARPGLIEAITHGDVESRVAAVRTLEVVGLVRDAEDVHTKQALDNLISALSHSDPRVRRIAAEALGRLGTVARSAVPALRARVGDEDEEVRTRASEALLSILEGSAK